MSWNLEEEVSETLPETCVKDLPLLPPLALFKCNSAYTVSRFTADVYFKKGTIVEKELFTIFPQFLGDIDP